MDKTSAPEKIVGALSTTGYITNDGEIVASWLKNGVIKKFLSKDEMKLMASFDLGENWRKMAESPVLFLLDRETGEISYE